VGLQGVEHVEPDVRQRAHRQRHPFLRQAQHQCGILLTAHAVVDALHVQDVEGLVDIGGRPLLAGMRDGGQARFARPPEHRLKLRRWMAGLRGVESHGREGSAKRQRRFERGHGIRGTQMPEEAQDQPGTDARVAFSGLQRPPDAGDHGGHGHAPRRVSLRVEEDLDVDHPLLGHPAQIGGGQRVEVFLVAQHGGTGIVDVQERLQIGEPIRAPQLIDVRIGQCDAVLARQREGQLGFERSLDVQVKFRLGQAADERLDVRYVAWHMRRQCIRLPWKIAYTRAK
jgi:hypothetical protein